MATGGARTCVDLHYAAETARRTVRYPLLEHGLDGWADRTVRVNVLLRPAEWQPVASDVTVNGQRVLPHESSMNSTTPSAGWGWHVAVVSTGVNNALELSGSACIDQMEIHY